MVSVKEVQNVIEPVIETRVNLPWVAVVYSPQMEAASNVVANLRQMAGLPSAQRAPACRHFQLPPQQPPNWKPGVAQEARSIQVNVGTNLGINAIDWEILLASEAEKIKRGDIPTLTRLLESKAIQVFIPDIDAGGEPSFRHFSPKLAQLLISTTFHEDWLDKWGEFETRADILQFIKSSKEAVIEVKRKKAA
jgi:hypothetical protein